MNSFYSHLAGATVRWFDFQGQGTLLCSFMG